MLQFRYCDLDFFSDSYQYPFENIESWCDRVTKPQVIEIVEVDKLSQINAVEHISNDLRWIGPELSNILKYFDQKLRGEPHGNVIIPVVGYANKSVFAVLRFCALPWLTEECPKYVFVGASVQLTKQCFIDGKMAKEGPNGIIYLPEFIVNGELQDVDDLPVPCKREKLPRQLAMIKKWLDSVMVRRLKEIATEHLQIALQPNRDDC